jgi:hypothetical protein
MTRSISDKGSSHDKTASADELIRSVMIEQKRVNSRQILPELEPVSEPEAPAPRKVWKKKKQGHPGTTADKSGSKPALMERIKAYRPARKHIALVALAGVMIWRPWLIPGILFVSFWVGLIVFLTLGPDRAMEKFASFWNRLERRRPQTADRLRNGADRFALKFDALLDRLPDHWAEKLALPDLSRRTEADADLDDTTDPFDRLKPLPDVYRG